MKLSSRSEPSAGVRGGQAPHPSAHGLTVPLQDPFLGEPRCIGRFVQSFPGVVPVERGSVHPRCNVAVSLRFLAFWPFKGVAIYNVARWLKEPAD